MAIEKAKIDSKEFEKIVVDLAKKGTSNEKIGLVLKKEYNVSKAKNVFGKRISQVLEENKIVTNPDIDNLKRNVESMKKHMIKNKQDQPTKRALGIREAKLRKLTLLQ